MSKPSDSTCQALSGESTAHLLLFLSCFERQKGCKADAHSACIMQQDACFYQESCTFAVISTAPT